jgi:hypothetical protein
VWGGTRLLGTRAATSLALGCGAPQRKSGGLLVVGDAALLGTRAEGQGLLAVEVQASLFPAAPSARHLSPFAAELVCRRLHPIRRRSGNCCA